MIEIDAPTAADTERIGALLARRLASGDAVLLEGPLGAGKTTLVRGALRELGFEGAVRSPTFNLLQVFPTSPPILHADLYRLESAAGIGLEDYLAIHACLIEWPDRLGGLVDLTGAWSVRIEFEGEGRRVRLEPPPGQEFVAE